MDSENKDTTIENKSEGENKSMFSYISDTKTNDTLDKKADITTIKGNDTSGIALETPSDNSGGILNFISKINWTTVLLIIVALALLGFNMFRYLGDATETTTEVFRPIITRIYNFFGWAITGTAKKTVELGAEGTKLGVDVIAGTVDSAIDITQDFALDDEYIDDEDEDIPVTVKKSVEKRQKKNKVVVTSDDSQSVFQKNSNKKSGWCYIGEDKGVRNCINVKEGDVCMSENIFPTRAMCTNPNIRE